MDKNRELLLKLVEQSVGNKKYDSTIIQFDGFDYTWEIVNFKNSSSLFSYITKDITSPWFEIPLSPAKINLQIVLAFKEASGNYIDLFFLKEPQQTMYKMIRLEVSLLDTNKNRKVIKNKLLSDQCGPQLASFPNYVLNDFVFDEKNGLLPNGSLIINCKIYFQENYIHYSRPLNAFNEIDRLKRHQKEFKQLLENGKFSDVTLVIDSKKFKVHKSILSTHSPVFSAMFEHKMKERNDNTVLITDIRAEVMKEVLNYLYTGDIENFETLGKDILAAANKYEINGLRMACEEKFINNLKIENIAEILTIIDSNDTIELKKYVLEFLKTLDKNFLKTNEFNTITKSISASLLTEIFAALSS